MREVSYVFETFKFFDVSGNGGGGRRHILRIIVVVGGRYITAADHANRSGRESLQIHESSWIGAILP